MNGYWKMCSSGDDVLTRHNLKPNRMFATILFVDIVRSTEKAVRLGDPRWSEVMNRYYAAVRGELRAARGKRSNHNG